MTVLLSAHNLGKTFHPRSGPVRVLHEINIELTEGEFSMLTGPSGSGKTTLLHLMGFLSPPSEGTIYFQGHKVGPEDHAVRVHLRRNDIGVVFQHSGLLPKRTVLQNVMFRNRYRGRSKARTREESIHALEQVGLEGLLHRKAEVLSGGEAQRTALARSLVGRPKLILADEPTGNLDEGNAVRIMDILSRIAESGTTVAMVTHHLGWLERADSIFSFHEGKLKQER